MNNIKKYPPYGKVAANEPAQGAEPAIIICIGSGGFERARNAQVAQWCGSIKHKLVLPFGTAPELYNWPVADHLVLLWPFGDSEPREIVDRLAVCCLNHRAVRVLFIGATEMRRYLPSANLRAA